MTKKILLVDDDPNIRDVIVFALEKAGMKVTSARDGREALELFRSIQPSLVVLDIGMPEMDGLEVCKEIRKSADTPVLFLSSRDEEVDRIVGLEIGGDDYVTKPFSPRELVARINAILKRTMPIASAAKKDTESLFYGLIELNSERHQVCFDKKPLALTSKEFAIMKGMLRYPGNVFDRQKIIDLAYDVNIHVSDRTIDSHIRHIRSKFQECGCTSVIETVHGVGYKLGTCR